MGESLYRFGRQLALLSTHSTIRLRTAHAAAELVRQSAPSPSATIVDIGCGRGEWTELFVNHLKLKESVTVQLYDPDRALLGEATERLMSCPNVTTAEALESSPVNRARSVDTGQPRTICLVHSIYHLGELSETISALRASTGANSAIVIVVRSTSCDTFRIRTVSKEDRRRPHRFTDETILSAVHERFDEVQFTRVRGGVEFQPDEFRTALAFVAWMAELNASKPITNEARLALLQLVRDRRSADRGIRFDLEDLVIVGTIR
jgi:hypothetical protein